MQFLEMSFQHLDNLFSRDDSDSSDIDTSSSSSAYLTRSGITTNDAPHQHATRKRPRDHCSESSSDDIDSSSSDENSQASINRKKGRGKHNQQRVKPRRLGLRSPSPFHEWEVGKEIYRLTSPDSSNNENESTLPSSYGPDSELEVDWESFLHDNGEDLPPSTWEQEFSEHQTRVFEQSNLEYMDIDRDPLEDQDDIPWYPYDPESVPPVDSEHENDTNSAVDEVEFQKTICYGMIHNVRIKILPQALESLKEVQLIKVYSEMQKEREIYIFKLAQEGNGILLQPTGLTTVEPHQSKNIAVLNREVTAVLSNLVQFCDFEAYSFPDPWKSVANGSNEIEKNTFMFIDVIVYGPQDRSQEVGTYLNDKKLFLQEPDYWKPDIEYQNPHFLDLSSVDPEPQDNFEQTRPSFWDMNLEAQEVPSNEHTTDLPQLKQRIALAFKNMTRAQSLKRISADIKIRTELKPYQEEALDFIMQRECGSTPEEYCLWKPQLLSSGIVYRHVITGQEKLQEPAETGGGILADEMGLGKTLTMLSAMMRSAKEAKDFASSPNKNVHLNIENPMIHSRATLVVLPSPLILNEWIQQFELHCTGLSDYKIYHSHGREGNPKLLAESDIVLSTYHTISHESTDATSPIWQIKWFRVILDEAHIIRRMSTKLFKAMKKLHAKFYWCLTGTPVQNSLEDLAALISFIRASPLDDLHKFRKHVVTPLTKGSENSVENLRQLLDSVCLRRTKRLLNLPDVISETRLLSFSAAEERRYNDTRKKLVNIINEKTLKLKNGKGYLGVFQLQLQLRRLCNHGTFQKAPLGADEFDPEQAIALLKKKKEARCQVCSVKVTGIHGIEEQRSGAFTICGHLLCMKCAHQMKLTLQKSDEKEGPSECSLCTKVIQGSYIVNEEQSSKSSANRGDELSAWQYFDENGCSSKVSAVIEDVELNQQEGKCIIFSCWTRSLDLIELFLRTRKIPFVRIDGSYSLGNRKRTLAIYQSDPAVKVLLMTTGTGAVGYWLNLTVATCVYLLEPQWNPMVEHQAIARVLRLGQKRNVKVVRYIMKGTVEELELKSQQIRKLEFAKVGWRDTDGL